MWGRNILKMSSALFPILVLVLLSNLSLATQHDGSDDEEQTEEKVPVVEITKKILEVPATDLTKSMRVNEIGFNVGTPGGINVVLGQWGTAETPILTRMSGMYWGDRARGAQIDFGWVFDHEGVFKQFLSVTGVYTAIKNPEKNESVFIYGFGPSYGFNLLGFSAQLGSAVGRAEIQANGKPRRDLPASIIVQFGYSLLF